jgi:hypothetical protein
MFRRYFPFIFLMITLPTPGITPPFLFGVDAPQKEDRPVKDDLKRDRYGDPLPHGAVARLGTTRWRVRARAICFFPDGKTLATAGDGVRLWDLNTGKSLKELALGKLDQTALAVSADGKALAWGGFHQPIVLWDESTDQKRLELAIDAETSPQALAFSPDGKTLAALVEKFPGVGNHPSPPRVWEVATGRELDPEKPDSTGRTWWPLAGYNLVQLTNEEATQLNRIAASQGFHHTRGELISPSRWPFLPSANILPPSS